MYEKILVPLDGSALSELALPYPEELGQKLGSAILLLHVCKPGDAQYFHMDQLYLERILETTRMRMGERAKVESVVLSGNPAEQIIDYAEENNIGLLTMATHGRSGIKRWVLGSIADKVVRETTKPVLLIRVKGVSPAEPAERMLNKVVVPLDGSDVSEAVLPHIEEIAPKLKAQVALLQVVAPTHYTTTEGSLARVQYSEKEINQLKAKARDYLEKAGAGLKSKGVAITFEVAVGKAAEEIVNFANRTNADLVAMATHGWSGFNRLFLGSVADRVLHTGNTPLLLVKPL